MHFYVVSRCNVIINLIDQLLVIMTHFCFLQDFIFISGKAWIY